MIEELYLELLNSGQIKELNPDVLTKLIGEEYADKINEYNSECQKNGFIYGFKFGMKFAKEIA